jgi:predicted secreted Zn-dependent protease
VPTNALEEQSPYYFQALGLTQAEAQGWFMWKIVLEILRRYEATGITQQELPRSIQRPGAAVGLAIRQAALAAAQRADEPQVRLRR